MEMGYTDFSINYYSNNKQEWYGEVYPDKRQQSFNCLSFLFVRNIMLTILQSNVGVVETTEKYSKRACMKFYSNYYAFFPFSSSCKKVC